MSSLLFGVVYAGLLLVPGMKGLWQAVGRYVLDATVVACTTACVGFWVMTTSAREVCHVDTQDRGAALSRETPPGQALVLSNRAEPAPMH